jgi:uncharacterized protein (TIGR02145 family)
MFLGMSQTVADNINYSGTNEGTKMKEAGTEHWLNSNTGTNESGFTALPGGMRYWDYITFTNLGDIGVWWSSTNNNTSTAWQRQLASNEAGVYRNTKMKDFGFSVRCLKD